MVSIVLGAVFVGVIVGIIVHWVTMRRYETAVVETEIIKEEPIMKRQAESTGYSVGYGKSLSYHEHYRYKDVKVGEKVTFRVTWNNGYINTITCNEGDATFKRLYGKLRK